jgi:hypothetical protein
MIRSTKVLLLGAAVLGALAFGATGSRAAGVPADATIARAAASTLLTDAGYRRHRYARYRERPYVLVQPYPQSRGFYDPGYAYHGNINGCVVDLGYGRYEPCNGGR